MKCDNKYRLNRSFVKDCHKEGLSKGTKLRHRVKTKTVNNECGN